MSPSKFQDADVTKGSINGPRPSPLKITRDSHSIHKPSQPFDNSSHKHHHSPSAKRQPVIIYTHSPKVIHAQARDFMALVQKLTGLTRSDDENPATVHESKKDDKCCGGEECGGGGGSEEIKPDPSSIDPDSSSDFFYSSRSNSMFQPPNQLAYMSYMKEFSEYK